MIEIDVAAFKAAKAPKTAVTGPIVEIVVPGAEIPADPGRPGTWSRDLADLYEEATRIRKQRDILSTMTANLVDQVHEQLREESPAVAAEFMKGNVPVADLAEHYTRINKLTDQAAELYDKIRYVEQYGHLPESATAPAVKKPQDPAAISYQIRRLDDQIYKTTKSLRAGKAKNPSRMGLWKEKLALLEARRDELKAQLKNLQYEARGKRAGEG